ncbi:MAG: Y-family DNA polymerase [Thermoguttaceae bacterium]|nr:Y-family DNA polymerase [Thermoguttaceae bacterium]
MYGLVDCNSFFASCEKVFVPRLWDRPVVVLSNNDGCIVARSQEAKDLGIKMGEPYFQVRRKCEELGIAVFSANFPLYANLSHRVMQTLRTFCPELEVYSIDEAFLDLTGVADAETEAFQRRVIETVKKWTGIPVSFGVGPTKTLAKIATHVAKVRRIGCFTLNDSGTLRDVLREIPVEEVWGVGRRLAKSFRTRGVRTAWDLYNQNPIQIRHDFSICQERTVRELRGEPCLELEDFAPPKYSIQFSRSFGTVLTSLDALTHPVSVFCETAMERLRKFHLYTGAVWLSLYGFTAGAEVNSRVPYSDGVTIPLEGSTDDSLTVLPRVLEGLKRLYREDVNYQKASVTLLAVTPEPEPGRFRAFQSPEEQAEDDQKAEVHRNLMNTLDLLHQELGRTSIVFASEGLKNEQEWRSRHEMRSPGYTTEWEEIPEVK